MTRRELLLFAVAKLAVGATLLVAVIAMFLR